MLAEREMTAERKELRRRRLSDPLGQPEIESVTLAVRWDIGIRSIIPEYTSELMPQIGKLAAEILLLSTCANERSSDNELNLWEACALLCGVDLENEIDPYACRPSLDRADTWLSDTHKRVELLQHFVHDGTCHRTQARPGMPPKWIPEHHQVDGWLMFVDRLAGAMKELSQLNRKANHLLCQAKGRVEIELKGTKGPNDILPASSFGGRRQTVRRRYAQRLAAVLAFPDWQIPRREFERWTEGELARLFKKLGFGDLITASAVKELIRPYKRAIRRTYSSEVIPSPSNYFGPHIRRQAKTGG